MGSMGMLLADWSIELMKGRRKKEKQKKQARQEEKQQTRRADSKAAETQTTVEVCLKCQEKHGEILSYQKQLDFYKTEKQTLDNLLVSYNLAGKKLSTDSSLQDWVEQLLADSCQLRQEVSRLQQEEVRLAESVGRQLSERDRVHTAALQEAELLALEKEQQLLASADQLRRQLATACRQAEVLQQREEQLLRRGNEVLSCGGRVGVGGRWEQEEVESLKIVLDMRHQEIDELRAGNNSLLLELERWRGVELRLQQQKQRAEEMEAVVAVRNQEIRRLCEEQESLQHQLEIEESAHLVCQQELERSQWALENFLSHNKEKVLKNLTTPAKDTGLIMDLVHKDKSLAYSFNC